ncbi:alpha/beta hydrolase [Amycolatopsis sp. MtRt-6]|uniref:alpha/beta hydrolase n=1 Tax=Amycolatopsis sp. MtRt-6 TaxID=2792782 RepID=UPI001A9091D8|nr:alpha/beta hydrolase [Amycolatopsis sp. MtRt-6]
MIDYDLSAKSRRLAAVLATLAVTVTPPASPGAAAWPAPAGAAAWLADSRRLPDPVTTDPAGVHRFLASAGEAGRRELAARYPGVVGALDGAPPELRYTANRVAMRAAGPPYRDRAGQFLLFDPRGDGRVAQVFGDLATADRIAVLVPGAATRADNFWTGVGDRRYRAPAVQAAGLHRSATALGAGGTLAVIAWLGYDAPDGVTLSAAREDLAQAGAVALRRFVSGLVAVRPQATIALLGHSYGSTVIGLAAPGLPRQVTDLAAFGSPGMGVDDVTGLHTTARVWAGQARGDWIRWVPGVRLLGLGHGRKPADPAFGARVFATADVIDHDHYLSPGTDSLAALTRIALGTDPAPRP